MVMQLQCHDGGAVSVVVLLAKIFRKSSVVVVLRL